MRFIWNLFKVCFVLGFIFVATLSIIGVLAVSQTEVHKKVADDMVARYELALRHGSKVDVCVSAGFVTAAYLSAKDEDNYAQWKQVEAKACKRAGVRQ